MWSGILKKALETVLITFLSLLVPGIAAAACHAVSVNGSGNLSGSDWNNTMANLPATMVRGDTYYLADGRGYNLQGLAVASGTIVTTVKKAMAADQGQGCTPSIGAWWNAATMGSGQAVFVGEQDLFGFAYFVIDGQRRTALNSGHGIKLDGSGCKDVLPGDNTANCHGWTLGANGSAKANNVTIRYTETTGSQAATLGLNNSDRPVFAYANDVGAGQLHDITLEYNYFHHSACDFILTRNVTNFTAQFNYFYLNNGGTECHGQAWEENLSTSLIARYNVFNDIQGTATLVVLNDDASARTTTGWDIYGNVFYDYIGGSGWNSNGTVACINTGITCVNIHVYNNTFANQQNNAGAGSNSVGATIQQSTCTNCDFKNNIFYNVNANVAFQIDFTEDYNSIIFSGARSGILRGTHDIVDAANTNLFTNFNVAPPASSNFLLTGQANSDYTGGVSLAPPYNQSCSVLTCSSLTLIARGGGGIWERGAYQFISGSASGPNPPQNLVLTSVQ